MPTTKVESEEPQSKVVVGEIVEEKFENLESIYASGERLAIQDFGQCSPHPTRVGDLWAEVSILGGEPLS